VAGGWTSASRLRWKAVGGHRLATVALARGLAASEGFGGVPPSDPGPGRFQVRQVFVGDDRHTVATEQRRPVGRPSHRSPRNTSGVDEGPGQSDGMPLSFHMTCHGDSRSSAPPRARLVVKVWSRRFGPRSGPEIGLTLSISSGIQATIRTWVTR
jgi:hypothetical protein